MSVLNVRVIPNAKQNKIVDEEGKLKVYVTAPPDKGRANKALIELLADYYNVKRSSVRIVRGESSRNKVVEITM